MDSFDIKNIRDKEIKKLCIECYKGNYYVSGIIDDIYHINASNNGEYRYDLTYKSDEIFTLKSFDYASLTVSIKENGKDKIIYTYNP